MGPPDRHYESGWFKRQAYRENEQPQPDQAVLPDLATKFRGERTQPTGEEKNRSLDESPIHDHFVSQAISLDVQNMPDVFPEDPYWHRGSVESWQSLAPVHIVVHPAKFALRPMQLKQVVPDAIMAAYPANALEYTSSGSSPASKGMR